MFPAKRWRRRSWSIPESKCRPGARPIQRSSARPALEVLEDRLAPAAWTAFGPAAINNGWNGNEVASGRIAALAPDPTDANTIYIAAAGGGVWKTSNANSASPTWTPLTDTQSTLFMGSIAVAAGTDINHRVIYAGTGEANFSGHDTFYGRGVLVSKDSGATWTLTGNSLFNRLDIGSVVIDPSDATGNTAYAAVSGEPDNGLNGGDTGNWGIWKTTNGGTTWTNTTAAVVDPSTASVNPFTSLIMDPNNHLILYAAVGEPSDLLGTNAVYKTINGGASWTSTTFPGTGTGRITLAIAKNSTTLYASVSDPSMGNFGATLEIEKSIDAGTTWSAVMTETSSNYINYMGSQGWYDQTLIVDPSDLTGNTVYAAGQANTDPSIYPLEGVIKSSDGGTTWTDITRGANGSEPHVDHHGIGLDANGKLLDGNDGGIWRLDNPTVGNIQWTDLNGNLNITQFTGAALDPTTASVVYGGSQDNGTEKYTGSTAWNLSFGGDGGFVRVNPTNHLTLYTENFGISLQRSTDGGSTWKDVSTGITGTAPTDNNPIGQASFYIPYVLDPTSPSRIVLGTTNVNESLDQGTTWATIATPGVNGFTPGTDGTGTQAGVTAIATRGNTVYAAMSDGTVWVATNDGGSWTERNPMPPADFVNGPFMPGGYQDLEIDQADTTGNTAYIVTAQFEGDISGTAANPHHVFKTTNGGATWTDISGNLPDLPVWSIAIDHGHNTLYVGNDNGVYVSTNGGSTWSVMGTGMPNVQVTSLEYNASLGVLAAGTHGRGLWEIAITQTPVVSSVAPSSGPTAGGTTVTITGSFFTASSTVEFGATSATNVTFMNTNTLMAVSPPEAAGTVDVTVTTVNGTSATSAADQFTFVAPPTVTSISPSSGPSTGGTGVTITGMSFTPTSTVNFGATPASNVTFVSATDLVAVAPAGAVDSTVDVTVTTVGVTSATSAADQYTYYGPLAKYNVAVAGSSTVQAGSNFLVTIQAADAAGTPISNYSGPSPVTASISPTTAASNFPVTVSVNSAGFGFFQGNIQAVGSYTITAAAGAITGSSTSPANVVAAAAAKLAFTVQPANTPTGVTLPAVTVQIQDAFGNVINTDNTDVVSLSIGSGPGSFLGSTTSVTVASGTANFNNLKLVVPGTYTLNAFLTTAGRITGVTSSTFTVLPLQVVAGSFAGTSSGFSLQFNAPYLINSLTPVLYGQGFGPAAPAPSVIVTMDPANLSDTKAYVTGSLVLSPATNSMTFVSTDTSGLVSHGTPILPDGIYTVIVRSSAATDGFQAFNNGGGFLDGLGTGTPGSGDFKTSFTVNAQAAGDDVVWVPAVAEGPGQVLNAPGKNQAGGGYPIYLDSSTASITNVQVTVNYNSALLTVTGVTGTGFSLLGSSTPGHAVLQYSGPALAAGTKTPIGFLTATVPSGTVANPVPYKMKDLLHLSNVVFNNSAAVPVTTADALHLVAYVGDGDGNGSYSSNDAVLITRALLNADTGFVAYPLVDPVIVADTDGTGFIPADAALQANEAGVAFPTANLSIPPVPPGVQFQVIGNNVDPSVSVAFVGSGRIHAAAGPDESGHYEQGSTVTVAVNIDDPHPAGSSGLIEAHLALTYDPRVLTVSAADVHLGSVLAGGGWSLVPTIDPATGQIAIALSSIAPITGTAGGSLVIIDFHAVGRISNPSSIDLVASAAPDGQPVTTELEDAQGTFTLSPAPSNGFDPRLDSMITPAAVPSVPAATSVDGDVMPMFRLVASGIATETPALIEDRLVPADAVELSPSTAPATSGDLLAEAFTPEHVIVTRTVPAAIGQGTPIVVATPSTAALLAVSSLGVSIPLTAWPILTLPAAATHVGQALSEPALPVHALAIPVDSTLAMMKDALEGVLTSYWLCVPVTPDVFDLLDGDQLGAAPSLLSPVAPTSQSNVRTEGLPSLAPAVMDRFFAQISDATNLTDDECFLDASADEV